MHFSTDIWSSAVVILGLVCVKVSEWQPSLSFLKEADAIAALMVALIVVKVSVQLGVKSIHTLLDAAPEGLEQEIINLVQGVAGVANCHQVRIRYSGAQLFVDLHILVDGNQTLYAAHALTDLVEKKISEMVPNADVTVHPEPTEISQ